MRPDEHKKKKNAAYKKKHNIHADKKSGSGEQKESCKIEQDCLQTGSTSQVNKPPPNLFSTYFTILKLAIT